MNPHLNIVNTGKIKVGITGQPGFIGTHLYNYLGLKQDIKRIPFEDAFFNTELVLRKFVADCDVIIHLAAMNRHNEPQILYETNIHLVKLLIQAMESENVAPHVIFSSSTQESLDNPYGKSKKEGRELFMQWAKKNKASFTGLIIPNVFGPFGHPFYNSVIATFSYQLAQGEKPQIHIDKELDLIYVGELIEEIYNNILQPKDQTIITITIKPNYVSSVSEILKLLISYKESYFNEGIFPSLINPFERNLFNTFVCYFDIDNYFPRNLTLNADERGSFVETVKLNSGGQVSFSITKPGITRGNHFHIRKAERFAVIKGDARIQLRRIGIQEIYSFDLHGEKPAYVDMPVWHTHNITNTGKDDLYTIFWISEQYNPDDPDTYFEKV